MSDLQERIEELRKTWQYGNGPGFREALAIIDELQRENCALKAALDDAETANRSAAVCAEHIEEFTGDGCLVCEVERLKHDAFMCGEPSHE